VFQKRQEAYLMFPENGKTAPKGGSNGGAYLEVIDLSHSFTGNGHWVLRNVSFTLAGGELVCLTGRSGCGKSTVINVLAGFLVPTSGRCLLSGREVAGPGPDRCVVFQEDALFPWLTVRENVAFGLKNRLAKKEQADEVERFLQHVGLQGYGDYLPREISGGMKQRVALARVLIRSPRILLMDEPFGALDAQSRENMQELLLNLWREKAQTILFVTHDVQEAVALADRILLIDPDTREIREELVVHLDRPRDRGSENFQAYCRRLRQVLR
jgi:NitT/TauT family transport system ATP-binding protein